MRGVIAVFAGVVLALPYIRYARRRRRALGYGLIAAAAIYVVFAAVAGDVRAVLVEIVGLGAFAGIAVIGIRRSANILALGWVAHVAWDVLFHSMTHSGYAPWWYPAACIGFDLAVAADVLKTKLRT